VHAFGFCFSHAQICQQLIDLILEQINTLLELPKPAMLIIQAAFW
jgi:hypothetical protein